MVQIRSWSSTTGAVGNEVRSHSFPDSPVTSGQLLSIPLSLILLQFLGSIVNFTHYNVANEANTESITDLTNLSTAPSLIENRKKHLDDIDSCQLGKQGGYLTMIVRPRSMQLLATTIAVTALRISVRRISHEASLGHRLVQKGYFE